MAAVDSNATWHVTGQEASDGRCVIYQHHLPPPYLDISRDGTADAKRCKTKTTEERMLNNVVYRRLLSVISTQSLNK